jgi:hypothetical protein
MRQRAGWIAAGLALIALALRLYRLNDGMWLDEIYTWVRFMRLPLSQIPSTYGSENQHFLFSLLARASMDLFGEHVWAFRLPAALFGAASVWAMYLFGKSVAGEREGLFTAALLAFSYHHVWFSQNGRGYSGLLFWTLVASWLLLNALASGSRRLWLAYAAAAALGVYTQATMVFVLLCHSAIAALAAWRSREWRGPLAGFGAGFVLTVLLHAPALPAILSGVKGTVSVVNEWKNPVWTMLEIASGLRIGFAGAAAGAAAVALLGAGMWSYARTRPTVLALLLIPPGIGTALLLAMGHHVWPRFYYFSFGFAALIVVRGALMIPRFGLAACLAMLALSAVSVPFAYGPKQDYGAARRYVLAEQRAGDEIVTADLTTWVYERFYGAGWTDVRTPAELEAVRRRASRTWFVYTLEPVFRAQLPEVHATVLGEFRRMRAFPGTLNNGAVVVCLDTRASALSKAGRP